MEIDVEITMTLASKWGGEGERVRMYKDHNYMTLSMCTYRKLHTPTTMILLTTLHLIPYLAVLSILFYTPTLTLDIGGHGERIILQSDVETVFISTPLRGIESLLYDLGNNTQRIQKTILTQVIPNEIGSNKGKWNFQKETVGILNENLNKIWVLKACRVT